MWEYSGDEAVRDVASAIRYLGDCIVAAVKLLKEKEKEKDNNGKEE